MILFLIPVTTIPFGSFYFTCLEDYLRNPFEEDSQMDIAARNILRYGGELHVSPYEDMEHAIENLQMFDGLVHKEAKIAAYPNEAFGPAYVFTKGFTQEQIGTLLDIMPTKAPRCVLALHIGKLRDADFTVNPYCLNKLE